MLYELISEFAKWLSTADEEQIKTGNGDLSYESLIVFFTIENDKVVIKNVLNIEEGEFTNKLDMDVDFFTEIASKLLNNRKKELQKQRIIELGNEEPYK